LPISKLPSPVKTLRGSVRSQTFPSMVDSWDSNVLLLYIDKPIPLTASLPLLKIPLTISDCPSHNRPPQSKLWETLFAPKLSL
jgi:hypothetical protein